VQCESRPQLLINDEELPHHAQILVIKNMAVEHVRDFCSGIRIESGGDNDLTFGIRQQGDR